MSKSLLTGLLYDPSGNRFTPSHAAKGARRYHYYVSQAVIKKPGRATDGPVRLPADELEELVISQVQSFLQSPQRMQNVLCDPTAGSVEIQRAADCARKWPAATVAQVRAVVPSVVQRVVVRDGLVELQLSKSAIREAVEFCRSQGLALSTLGRHLRKQRSKHDSGIMIWPSMAV